MRSRPRAPRFPRSSPDHERRSDWRRYPGAAYSWPAAQIPRGARSCSPLQNDRVARAAGDRKRLSRDRRRLRRGEVRHRGRDLARRDGPPDRVLIGAGLDFGRGYAVDPRAAVPQVVGLLDAARVNEIDRDPEPAQLEGDRAGHVGQCQVTHRSGVLPGLPPREASDIYDATPSLPLHVWCSRTRAANAAHEFGIEVHQQVVAREGLEGTGRLATGVTGVVDQDVDATECRNDLFEHALDGGPTPDIRGDRENTSP